MPSRSSFHCSRITTPKSELQVYMQWQNLPSKVNSQLFSSALLLMHISSSTACCDPECHSTASSDAQGWQQSCPSHLCIHNGGPYWAWWVFSYFQVQHCLYTFQAELRATIGDAIPQFLQLLKDDNRDVRDASASVMVALTEHSEFLSILPFSISYAHCKPNCMLWSGKPSHDSFSHSISMVAISNMQVYISWQNLPSKVHF